MHGWTSILPKFSGFHSSVVILNNQTLYSRLWQLPTAPGTAGSEWSMRSTSGREASADSSAKAYQGLAPVYAAIEPPTWALLLAESCRARGFGVGLLDCDAERLSLEESVARVEAALGAVCAE